MVETPLPIELTNRIVERTGMEQGPQGPYARPRGKG